MRWNKKPSIKSDKTETSRTPKRGVVGYSRKSALLEEAITQMNAGKYGRSSAALKELLALDPVNMEARRLFATLHLRLGSLIPAREAFDALITEAFQRQDYWLAESLLREYLAAGPRCVPYLEKLGMLHQEKGNAIEAVEEYGKAVDILIEDPDPEHPDHAAQLYAKIRELAPASPVAFRLAPCFDAETGGLVPRQSNAHETTLTFRQAVPEGEVGKQTSPVTVGGAMPWEVQVSPEGSEPPAATAHSQEVAGPTTQPERITDSTQQAQSSDPDPVPSGEAGVYQAEHTEVEAQTDGLAEVSHSNVGVVSTAEETTQIVDQGLAGNAPSSLGSVDSITEIAERPVAAHHEVVPADSAVTLQAPGQVPREVAEAGAVKEEGTASRVMSLGLEQTTDSSVGSSPDVVEPALSSQFQTDEVLSPPSLGTELSTESRPVQNKAETPPVTQEVKGVATEESADSTDSPIVPVRVSADEKAQPWKQPGFSWKSVFDTAWKFGEQSPAKDTSTSPAPNCLSETPANTPTVPPPQDQLVKDPAIETLKREGESQEKTEETSRALIVPMPWDQVQESALSIPPAEINSPVEEHTELSADHSQDSCKTPEASGNQLEPSSSAQDSDSEPDSFVYAQDTPRVHSEEQRSPILETEDTTKGTEKIVKSAPLFSFVRSAPAGEAMPSASQASDPQAHTQDSGIDSVVDRQEVPSEPTEFAIKPTQPHSGAVTEEVAQRSELEFQLRDSKSVEAVMPETVETVRHIEPAPIEGRVTEPIENHGGILSESQGTPEPLAQDNQPSGAGNVQAGSPIPESTPPQGAEKEAEVPACVSREYSATSLTSAAPVIPEQQEISQSPSTVSVSAEAFVEPSRIRKAPETNQGATTNLNGAGTTIVGFLRTCFSTTHAIVKTAVGLTMLVGICFALGLGALALTWMIMEEPPSATFHSFTTTPQQTLSGAQKNAYTLMVGFDAPVGQDPFRAGSERKLDNGEGITALGCFGNPGPEADDRSNAPAGAMRGWVRGSDPIGQLKSHQETIQGWGSRQQVTLERYRQWQKLPFEDWGYGQPGTPPCGALAFAHQLHVAEGFVQGVDLAVDRLETDMELWRVVLGQARTLPVKMLALQAINDDIALASGMLIRSDFDTKYLGRITKFVRPLEQGELSLRWPMQSELVSAAKTYENQIKAAKAEAQAMFAMVVSALPLPKQRRLNDYAEYYEASYQATGEKRYDSLPKWKDHVRFPAAGVMDYLANPIENLVGVEPLPAWDVYNGLVVDTDAHLRLASLQAWLRRGSSEGELANKIAKAGQDFYDPYTGLPMLVNQKKGLLYSVGHDGKDQDADPQVDVVVEIPFASTSTSQTKSSASSAKSR